MAARDGGQQPAGASSWEQQPPAPRQRRQQAVATAIAAAAAAAAAPACHAQRSNGQAGCSGQADKRASGQRSTLRVSASQKDCCVSSFAEFGLVTSRRPVYPPVSILQQRLNASICGDNPEPQINKPAHANTGAGVC